MKKKIRISIFASGNGRNAENILRYFKDHPKIEVHSVLCNKPDAHVLKRAMAFDVNIKIFTRDDLYTIGEIYSYLDWFQIDYIILAGFLWMIPEDLLELFPDRIINIHPALLPKYGGKGMYGMKVHQHVIENKDLESGVTIHLVNNKYDEGRILFQQNVPVAPDDTPETLGHKIYKIEETSYPGVIEDYILSQPS